jgi:hypothetical protein
MKRFARISLALSVLAVALAGCGVNDATVHIDGSVFARAQALPQTTGTQFERVVVPKASRSSSQSAAVRSPTVDEFFNWAELTFPTLFPVKTTNQTLQVYTYRYYPTTDLILAVTGNTVLGLVGVTSNAPRVVPLGYLSDFSCLVLPALCTGTPATIDATSVSTGTSEVAAFLSVCTSAAGQGLVKGARVGVSPALASRVLGAGRVLKSVAKSTGNGPAQASTTVPADKLGDCGGRMSHPVYSHVNGVTTATNQFDNYCQTDTDTGGKQIIHGSVSYVKTGTPSANGPVTTRMVSNSPAGVSFVTKNSSGATVTSQTISFSNYVYTPGVPGGDATSANPDRVQIDEFTIGDALTGKSYRQTGYVMSTYETSDGGSQTTVSGRGYRSNGTYFDLSSTTPMTTNKSGDFTGGVFTFAGAGSSTAVATLVPGSTLQATMTVGGAPLTNLPACAK